MYKVVKDEYVIDVLESLSFVRLIERNNLIVSCDESKAQGILSSDKESIWHISTLPDFTNGNYETVIVSEITTDEYNELKSQLASHVEIRENRVNNADISEQKKVLSYEELQQKIIQQNSLISQLNEQINSTIDISTLSLDEAKDYRQLENKQMLKEFFDTNPLLWTDGSYYGVTEEDQSEMIADMTLYSLKQSLGQTDWKLEWHNKKKGCREFTVEEFYSLINAIADFIYPYRRLQEYYKELIYSCDTMNELLQLEFIYGEEMLSQIAE